MTQKRNVVLYLDPELVEKSRTLGFNLSRTLENHLKQLITQRSNQQFSQNYQTIENKSEMVGLPELTALELNTYCSPHFFLRAVSGVMFLLRLG